ncbi:flavocytochrome c [Fundicoccus sp. Sow4_D5]|uniref:flavocytochrome c n=1 Tax=Fundicoccus sp. Sow4_D5 TaxID=3438782 RepID=UPI003F921709
MERMRKIIGMLLVVVLVGAGLVTSLTTLGSASAQDGLSFEAGTYSGVADGFGGSVEAIVTVTETRIENIQVIADGETGEIGTAAISEITEAIIQTQSLAVDVVSGASVSSNAVLAAIEDALKQAGADLDYLKDEANKLSVEAVEQADIDTEVVVIGAGGAGMAAAIEAALAGKDVVILEQMAVIGGNTNRATGGMNASQTYIQAELGVEDSNEQFYEDTFTGGYELNDPVLLRTMVEQSADALQWVNDLGAELTDVSFSGGQTNARIHKPKDGSAVGPVLIGVLKEKLDELDVPIYLESEAQSLITNDEGHVVGVNVVTADGASFVVNADAVILATGGFGANMEMVEQYDESKVGFETTNHPGATGSGIQMAVEIGAALYQMEEIQIHPTTQPGTGYLYTEGLRGDGAILVNKEGLRFTDELLTRDVVSANIIAQTDSVAYLLVNQELVDQNASMAGYIEKGHAVHGESLEELATALELDAATLQATLDTYNEAQAAGVDEEFGRLNMTMSLAKGPYYALSVTPSIHHTMGGLKINKDTQVLNEDGEIIPGLFAAGEVVGGVHGGNRIGGNAVLDIIVFGRIAGQMAATDLEAVLEEGTEEGTEDATEDVTPEEEEEEVNSEDASEEETEPEDSVENEETGSLDDSADTEGEPTESETEEETEEETDEETDEEADSAA